MKFKHKRLIMIIMVGLFMVSAVAVHGLIRARNIDFTDFSMAYEGIIDYGIDFSGAEVTYADIQFENEELIDNATDGEIMFTANDDLVQLLDMKYYSSNTSTSANDYIRSSFYAIDDNEDICEITNFDVVMDDETDGTVDASYNISLYTADSTAEAFDIDGLAKAEFTFQSAVTELFDFKVISNSATAANADYGRISFYFNTPEEASTEVFNMDVTQDDVTSTTMDATLSFSIMTDNTLGVELNLTGAALFPEADSGLDLGTDSYQIGDAYINGVIYCDQVDLEGELILANDETFTNAIDGVVSLTYDDDASELGDLRIKSSNTGTAATDYLRTSWYILNDGAGSIEQARLDVYADDVSTGTEDATINLAVVTAGTIANELSLNGAALYPSVNAGLDLGASSYRYDVIYGNTLNMSETLSSQTTQNVGATIALVTDSTYLGGTDITYTGGAGSAALKIDGTHSGVAGGYSNILSNVTSTAAHATSGAGTIGIKSIVTNTAAMTDGNLFGGQFWSKHNHGTNIMTADCALIGLEGMGYVADDGPARTVIGGNFGYHNEGATAKGDGSVFRGVQIVCDDASGASTAVENTGLCIWNMAGTQTNAVSIVKSDGGFSSDIVMQNGEDISNVNDGVLTITADDDVTEMLDIQIISSNEETSNADNFMMSWWAENDESDSVELAYLQVLFDDVTTTTEDATIKLGVVTDATLAAELALDGATLYPVTDEGLNIGKIGNEFGDIRSDGTIHSDGIDLEGSLVMANGEEIANAGDGVVTITADDDVTEMIDIQIISSNTNADDADNFMMSWWAPNSTDDSTEFAFIQVMTDDVTTATEDATVKIGVVTNDTLAAELSLDGATIFPTTNQGLVLGKVGNHFSVNMDIIDYATTATPRTITVAESGSTFVMGSGANDDPVTFNLPDAAAGLIYHFNDRADTEAADLTVNPQNADAIDGLTIGNSYRTDEDTVTATLTLLAVDGVNWVVLSSHGTWADHGS